MIHLVYNSPVSVFANKVQSKRRRQQDDQRIVFISLLLHNIQSLAETE